MSKKLRPLDYDTSGQEDIFLRALRGETKGLEDIVHDDSVKNFENITRSAYRDLERVLSLPKTERLDQITPHFLYSLFGAPGDIRGILSPAEQRVVGGGFKSNAFDEAEIPNPHRSIMIAKLKKIGLHLEKDTPIKMEREFFQKREPIFFREGMPASTVTRVDEILDGACAEFPDWLRMRFGSRRDRILSIVEN